MKLAFDVNSQGKANHSSLYAKNELGKKVISGMKAKHYKPKSTKVEEYTIEIVNFVNSTLDKKSNSLMTFAGENYFVIHTEGPGAQNNDFNEKLENKVEEINLYNRNN